VLEAKVFACLARRLQTEEIRAAMIPDLETCPFCPFSYIPDDNSLVFECQEDTCQKVSCRFVTTTLCCSKLLTYVKNISANARSLTIYPSSARRLKRMKKLRPGEPLKSE
jgi:hypothetical protein